MYMYINLFTSFLAFQRLNIKWHDWGSVNCASKAFHVHLLALGVCRHQM